MMLLLLYHVSWGKITMPSQPSGSLIESPIRLPVSQVKFSQAGPVRQVSQVT
jgi:hypothetical protein